jgi:two-component system CheB/CheR fusion protein
VQGERTLDRSQGGLGLGLTLVKGLVEMHGGSVQAMSEGPGRGSEFVIRLPADKEDTPRDEVVEGSSNETMARATGRRILVVDDNIDAAESLALLLKIEGHSVEMAHDGVAALEAVRKKYPDVVLLDIGLPRMDGYEVARRLRSMEDQRDTLLVALTGYGQTEDRRRSREAGFDHHLVKPVDR